MRTRYTVLKQTTNNTPLTLTTLCSPRVTRHSSLATQQAQQMFNILASSLCVIMTKNASKFKGLKVHESAQVATRLFKDGKRV